MPVFRRDKEDKPVGFFARAPSGFLTREIFENLSARRFTGRRFLLFTGPWPALRLGRAGRGRRWASCHSGYPPAGQSRRLPSFPPPAWRFPGGFRSSRSGCGRPHHAVLHFHGHMGGAGAPGLVLNGHVSSLPGPFHPVCSILMRTEQSRGSCIPRLSRPIGFVQVPYGAPMEIRIVTVSKFHLDEIMRQWPHESTAWRFIPWTLY